MHTHTFGILYKELLLITLKYFRQYFQLYNLCPFYKQNKIEKGLLNIMKCIFRLHDGEIAEILIVSIGLSVIVFTLGTWQQNTYVFRHFTEGSSLYLISICGCIHTNKFYR